MMEGFRSVVEQFVIDYHPQVNESSFELKGCRVFLKRDEMKDFFKTFARVLFHISISVRGREVRIRLWPNPNDAHEKVMTTLHTIHV